MPGRLRIPGTRCLHTVEERRRRIHRHSKGGLLNMPGTAQAGRAAAPRGARSTDLVHDRSIITVNENAGAASNLKALSAPTEAAATLGQLER